MTRIKIEEIEELAELISDKLIVDLEQRFNLNLRSLNERIITNVDEIEIQSINIDPNKNYLSWEIEEDDYKLKIIDNNLMNFYKETLCYSDENVYKKFLNKLQDDIKVSLTAESLLGLTDISKSKKQNKTLKQQKLQGVFFENSEGLKENMRVWITRLASDNTAKIMEKIDEESDIVINRVPKTLMPVAAYVLNENKNISGKLLNNILKDSNNVGIKWISSVYPNSKKNDIKYNKVIQESLLSYLDFIGLLNSKSEIFINKSLNLYLFNRFTNLYDLDILSRSIFKNSLEIKVTKTYFNNKKYEGLDKELRYKLKEKLCKKVVRLTQIKGLMTKKFIIENHINKGWVCKRKFIDQLNQIYAMGIESLKKSILQKMIKEKRYENIEGKIKDDYVICDLMNKVSPYDMYIQKLQGTIELINLPTISVKKTMKYEICYYTYKAIYNLKNPQKRA